jgi:hypothetical protein
VLGDTAPDRRVGDLKEDRPGAAGEQHAFPGNVGEMLRHHPIV